MQRMPRRLTTEPHIPDAEWCKALRRKLLAWYRRHQRDLPWRRSQDAYRVWLSEIMLQQTQVSTVVPYYLRFLERFPTVRSLASADESDVLRLWEGLGYYRRARQLHAAAKKIVIEHHGRFPSEKDAIRELPGIGRYTAGAIASIAFGIKAPIVEANTVRLYCRLIGYRGDPTSRDGQQHLWQFAESILPESGAGDVNQALMELGSLVCTPRQPLCETCCVRSHCAAHQHGWQDEIPAAKRVKKFEAVREAAVVVRLRNKVLLRRRNAGERWAGLWDFVRFPIAAKREQDLIGELRRKTYEQVGMQIRPGKLLASFKHGVTRFRITLDCYEADHVSGVKHGSGSELVWTSPSRLNEFPLSVTGRKLARLLV
jgi:A/G-specific adenine glycosylase